ncbi:hypothetical protein C8T65DRAFT_662201 [Cerioporus squamosus]|nr:hypothetical protein C8T65DRAFT_662201 [Cerioporus squamosus]
MTQQGLKRCRVRHSRGLRPPVPRRGHPRLMKLVGTVSLCRLLQVAWHPADVATSHTRSRIDRSNDLARSP